LGLRVLDSGFRVEGVDRVELWLNYGLQGPLANKDTPLPRVRGQGDAQQHIAGEGHKTVVMRHASGFHRKEEVMSPRATL
jgi:hypothetical protein